MVALAGLKAQLDLMFLEVFSNTNDSVTAFCPICSVEMDGE